MTKNTRGFMRIKFIEKYQLID